MKYAARAKYGSVLPLVTKDFIIVWTNNTIVKSTRHIEPLALPNQLDSYSITTTTYAKAFDSQNLAATALGDNGI